jgi:hypothetical protein
VNTKSPHIPIFFGDENTGEVNKALNVACIPKKKASLACEICVDTLAGK